MKLKHYSISVHWDRRYPKAGTNLCPIQLSVNLNGLQFKISLRLYSTREDWEKAMNGRGGSNEVKEVRNQILEYKAKAEKILDKLPNPTRETFQRLFKSETDLFNSQKTDATFFFNEYIRELQSEERIKSADNMAWAMKSLKKFRSPLYLEDIDETFLKKYVVWMDQQGNSATTAQIYLRSLRIIFNTAIKHGYISERFYPFKNYSIGASAKSKSVLYPPQLKALWDYVPTTMRERRSKAYFFFCYLCNGMNFKDAVYLKWKDVKTDTLSFIREKTKRTNRVSDKHITVYMHDQVKSIISEWGRPSKNPEDLVFPILDGCRTAVEKEKRRKTYQRLANKELNEIGRKLGFEEQLNLNIARHTFATRLKLDGTPTAFISDALGHTNSRTTEHYLKSIPDHKYKEISDTLLKFD